MCVFYLLLQVEPRETNLPSLRRREKFNFKKCRRLSLSEPRPAGAHLRSFRVPFARLSFCFLFLLLSFSAHQ